MAVKYVKDFFFGPMTSVQRYAKGGHVTKVPAKAKPAAKGMPARAKPNAPAKGAKRMESPPKVGKGQGYKDGGKVPGKQMDRQPTKTPPGRDKDLAPAKPFKGAYEGYAKGGKARRYAEGGDVQDPRFASIEPGAGTPVSPLNQYGEADPFEGRPVRDITLEPSPYRPVDESVPRQYDAGNVLPTEPSAYDPRVQNYAPGEMRGMIGAPSEPQMYKAAGPGPSIAYEDPAFYQEVVRQMRAEQNEPPMARAVRNVGAGRAVGLGDIMAAARNMGRRGFDNEIRYDKTGMPLLPNTPVDPSMRRVPGAPVTPGMYAKGGHVKGQAKVGKVMSEYKRGELHSGSKKGPLVKNPKQAVAIALSEARKSGAKIPRKEDGGLMASKPEVRKPKSVTVTKVTKTVSDAKDAALNEKKMLEFLRSLPKDEIADMMEKRAMQAPSMDPDMPKYRKGGMARKGVPAHKAKAMYGGGKC